MQIFRCFFYEKTINAIYSTYRASISIVFVFCRYKNPARLECHVRDGTKCL